MSSSHSFLSAMDSSFNDLTTDAAHIFIMKWGFGFNSSECFRFKFLKTGDP